ARLGLALGCAMMVSPLWLPLLPVAFLWWRRQRRRARAIGLLALDAQQARTIAAFAEATLPAMPAGGWMVVARNVDAYVSQVRSPRRGRTMLLLTVLEWAPLLRAHRPLSRQHADARGEFLARHMATTHGLLAIPALLRQLVRMGYYTDAGIAA